MLTEDGLPTGNSDITGDYSSTPTDFFVKPEEGTILFALGIKVFLTMKPNPNKSDYGELSTGLTNGIDFIFRRGTYERSLIPLGAIKCNMDFLLANGERTATGIDIITELNIFEFNFLQDFRLAMPLHASRDERFIVRANDDFSGQTTHSVLANGVRFAVTLDKQL